MIKSFFLSFLTVSLSVAEPILSSWLTELSGRYAQIYPDNDAMTANSPVTTWARGAGVQSIPTYAGVHEISYDVNNVYIRTTNLGFHIMGPWYGGTNLFPNYPANVAEIYRFPRTPNTSYTPKTPTGGGAIGYFVDGVSMYDSRDAFSYSTMDGEDEHPRNAATVNGDGIWLRDAYVNEGNTFDNAYAHQAGPTYHYHANPPGLRHLLGDSVDYDPTTNTYTENFNGNHSPILGWCRDGLPIYGPYGYSDPTDHTSAIRRMISGYQLRDGSNGSVDLPATGRTTLPQWVVRNEGGATSLASNRYGPAVDQVINGETYTLGRYLQDYAYKGDLTGYIFYEGVTMHGAYNPATHYDLNEYNVRFTVTPEYPSGTWAYFTNIEIDGTPKFPYNIARYYFAEPTGSSPSTMPASVTTLWEGGPEKDLSMRDISVEQPNGDVTLVWDSSQGGHYTITHSSDLADDWQPLAQSLADDATSGIIDSTRASREGRHFYQVSLDYIEPFDDTGFNYDTSIVSERPQHNTLLLILDDWGIDSSELYNTETGANLANMPNLRGLLFSDIDVSPTSTPDKGLLFTRGYSQPICSPTRATLLTGRQPYQHGVGNPADNATLPASELTFPEILTSYAPDYALASFGKWHLGSGNTGPFDTGGWPNFSGTLQGGVQGYNNWSRVKIENGILTDAGTSIADLVTGGTYSSPYATSVQVDEAVSFIAAQGSDPWVVWMGFNAPHDPFHDPAVYLTPTNGYSTNGTSNGDYYIKMLEALDHEIGRLLASVDLTKTNVIVVGDNGTPGQVDQAPAGGLAGAKGSLNEGGIHVPFFVSGPDVLMKGKTDTFAHVSDLFATILDLSGVNISVATNGIDLHSSSLLLIMKGSDNEDRCIISEKFGLNAANDGRALILDDWPNYKLLSIQDVTDATDVPTYQMYEIGANGMEISTLTTPPNPADAHEDAYLALVAKDQSLAPAAPPVLTRLDIDLPVTVPPLENVNNGNIISPQNITIGGVVAHWDTGTVIVGGVETSAARVDEGGNPDRFSVVAEFDETNSGLISGQTYDIIVTFPGAGGRDFTAITQYTAP